jgi:predicted alpha/beta-fold hydrolase
VGPFAARLLGHFWTTLPNLLHRVRPLAEPPSRAWSTMADDGPQGRPVRLSGRLSENGKRDTLVLILHGLGGAAGSGYCVRTARAVARQGWASLRLNLRGADGSGEDLYHAGLTSDVEAALASPELAAYRRLFLLGYSLGGHIALHVARRPSDPRLAAVATVCAPLDLTLGGRALDAPRVSLYRGHVLRGLHWAYAAYAARHREATPAAVIRRTRTIRHFDALAIVPRFGFADVDDYYTRMSVGPRLAELRLPALTVHARHDPMIPAATVEPHLAGRAARLTSWWSEVGGHVGFPSRVVVDGRPPAPLEEQILDWCQVLH